jgi:hypothetical protein
MRQLLLPFSFSLLVGYATNSFSADTNTLVKLTGIVCHGGKSRALLEITAPPPRRVAIKPILAAGERTENVEVKVIDEKDSE